MNAIKRREADQRMVALLQSRESLLCFSPDGDVWSPETRQVFKVLEATAELLGRAVYMPPVSGQTRILFFNNFMITYDKKYHDLVQPTLSGLTQADTAFAASGFPLGGRDKLIPLRIKGRAGGSARSIYTSSEGGYIQFVPSRITSSSAMQTFIHELAHYYHNHFIPNGFGNAAITEGFEQHKNDEQEDSLSSDAILDRIKEIKRAIKRLVKQIKIGERVKGLDNNEYEVVSISSGKQQLVTLRCLSQEHFGQMYLVTYNDVISNIPALNKMARSLQSQLDDLSRQYNQEMELGGGRSPDRYQKMLSKWVPTKYALTNPLEWWAELMTVAVLHSGTIDQEVLDWMHNVDKTGSAP